MKRQDAACDDPLASLIRELDRVHGFDLSQYDGSFLLRAIGQRQVATGVESMAGYRECVVGDRAEAEILCRSLCISYSEFFRNPCTFALLEQVILPGLVEEKAKHGQAEVRIWSAGCAGGQEAWSVAMLLADLADVQGRDIPFRIIATDASDEALTRARAGVYDRAAVANLRLRHLEGYLTARGDDYVIGERLRCRVDFSSFDLLAERAVCPPASLYGDFDLVLCCNLLLYYRPAVRQLMLARLLRALPAGGYLVTGEAERGIVAREEGLRAVTPPAILFQRRGGL